MPAKQDLSIDEARRLFEQRRQAWLSSDKEAYLALWAEDMTISLPGQGITSGKAAYREMIERSMQHLQPLSWEFHSLAVDGDQVLAEWTIAGEYRQSGKRIEWRGMSICRIEAGLIVEWREYWNPADLQQ